MRVILKIGSLLWRRAVFFFFLHNFFHQVKRLSRRAVTAPLGSYNGSPFFRKKQPFVTFFFGKWHSRSAVLENTRSSLFRGLAFIFLNMIVKKTNGSPPKKRGNFQNSSQRKLFWRTCFSVYCTTLCTFLLSFILEYIQINFTHVSRVPFGISLMPAN